MINTEAYVAVRKDSYSGTVWLDISTLSLVPEDAKKKALQDNERLCGGTWGTAQKLLRIAKVKITEISGA